jgi:aryl-alcohol dehydrogenase-like predicted oxidoreductase
LLTGKYRSSDEGRLTTLGVVIQREDSDQKTAVVDAVLRVADEIGSTPAQVAMAWELERGRRRGTAAVPIIGPRTPAQLEEYLGALDVTLTDDQYRRLDEVSAVEPGVPHGINAMIRPSLLGGDVSRFITPLIPIG